jgi:hypothetical protein
MTQRDNPAEAQSKPYLPMVDCNQYYPYKYGISSRPAEDGKVLLAAAQEDKTPEVRQ